MKAFAAETAAAMAWIKGEPGFHAIFMNYNRLLAEPRARLAELKEFFSGTGTPGLDLDAMCGVIDPALYRQRDGATVPACPALRRPAVMTRTGTINSARSITGRAGTHT